MPSSRVIFLSHFLSWGRERNFFTQIEIGKIMFSQCRALAKAWSDINKYHWKAGEEGRKKRKLIQTVPFLGHGTLKMSLLGCFLWDCGILNKPEALNVHFVSWSVPFA